MTHPFGLERFVGEGRVCTALGYALIEGDEPTRLGSIGCRPNDLFDLASLTKPLGTVRAVAQLIEDGALTLEQSVGEWLPEAPAQLGAATLADLLHHRAGLLAFSERLADRLIGAPERRLRELRRRVLELPLKHRPGTVVYSDLGFILCAWICQRAGMAVDELAAPQGFLIPSGADLERCIPTGYDPDQMPLKGRVHDPTCRRAGGRNCGHAGWFGGIEATAAAVRSWLDLACGRPSSVPRAASALIVPQHGGRTAGFDVPTPGGTTGGGWGARAFGHLGYTGTAFWIDPDADRAAVLLTNRTWPDGQDRGIGALRRHFFGAVARGER